MHRHSYSSGMTARPASVIRMQTPALDMQERYISSLRLEQVNVVKSSEHYWTDVFYVCRSAAAQ